MGDLITALNFILRLEDAKLIPSEEVEQIADQLDDSLKRILGSYRYDALMNLLDSSDGDSTNPLYIHLTK